MSLVVCVLALQLLSMTGTTNGLFMQPSYQKIPYPELTLTEADRLGIPYQSFACDAGKEASFPGFALSLNAKFGPLKDEATFQSLQKIYCRWSETKSRVKWKKGRSYTLLDFLPPLMQATSGLYFQSTRTKQRGLPSFLGTRDMRNTEQDVLLTSNCWGFAWEVLFQADNADTQSMTISTADPTSAWRAFTGPGFDLIQSSRTQPALLTDRALRNKKSQAGDVLLIWHQNPTTASGTDLYLDHVATQLDEDVYYEKSGSGDRVPFRITTWDGLIRNFPPSVFFWEWRRLHRNNPLSASVYGSPQTRLKPATELFGVDSQALYIDRFSLLQKIRPSVAQRFSLQVETTGDVVESQTYTGILVLEDLVFDPNTGRASLPDSAFAPEWYTAVRKMMPHPRDLYIK